MRFGFLICLVLASMPYVDADLKCTSCKVLSFALETALKNNSSEAKIFGLVEKLCVILNFYPAPVCDGIAKSMGPELLYLFNKYNVAPVNICYRLSFCKDPNGHGGGRSAAMPALPPRKKTASRPNKKHRRTLKKMRLLQMTDIHFDPLYQVGQDTTCQYPICCRNSTNEPRGGGHKSRRWGEYTCDPPEVLLDSIFSQAATMFPDIDGIIWNGDNRCADIWMYTLPDVLDVTTRVTNYFKKYFPNVPVFPTIGNHDNSPIDQFWMPEYTGLLQSFLELWSDWIPADQHEQFLSTGYWTGLLQPGVRLISLHTTWADLYNWYGLINVTDPGGQLAWLTDVLLQAEQESERVVIIGHIPMIVTGELERHYAAKYSQIVLRFSDIIAGSHWGHTHESHFALTQVDGSAQLVQLMSGSVTPREGHNPQIRLVEYNEEGNLLNFHQYVVRLNSSYATPSSAPVLEFLYDAVSSYGLPDMSPTSLQAMAERMFSDDILYNLYLAHEYGDSPLSVRPKPKEGDRVKKICNMLHSIAAPYNQCVKDHGGKTQDM